MLLNSHNLSPLSVNWIKYKKNHRTRLTLTRENELLSIDMLCNFLINLCNRRTWIPSRAKIQFILTSHLTLSRLTSGQVHLCDIMLAILLMCGIDLIILLHITYKSSSPRRDDHAC